MTGVEKMVAVGTDDKSNEGHDCAKNLTVI